MESNNGQITRSFTSASLSGSNLSGFAGDNSGGSLTATYWDTEATGQSDTDGSSTGLTTSELQGENARSNLTDFDFDSVWTTTDGYPKLQD